MACPHHDSLQQLADVILGIKPCLLAEKGTNGHKCDPAECVDALKLDELRPFFKDNLPTAFRLAQENNQSNSEALEAKVRSSLGVWYATSFLLNVYPESQSSLLQTRMRAIGKEALQWYEDSFLTHVLVYFRSPHTELVQHYTTVLEAPGQTREDFDKFLKALQGYILEYGTTVRGDAHLKRVTGTHNRPRPLGETRLIKEEFEDFSPLKLPPERDLTGDEDAYGRVLLEHFGKVHPPQAPEKVYGQLHLAGGCDTQYLNEDASIGAVAHMYIAFKGKKRDNYVFNHVMRAMLSRLAMSFSLEEMSKQAEDIRRIAADERRRKDRLLRRVTDLDVAIHKVEEAARGVRSIIQRNVWQILKEWMSVLAELFTPGKPKHICEVEIAGRHHYWEQEHFAASLLHLVSATNNERIENLSLIKKWHYYRQNVHPVENNENPVWRCLQRRGMLEPDTLDKLVEGGEDLLQSWKDGLSKVKPESNGASVLLMLFAIGAKADATPSELAYKFFLHQGLNIEIVANGLNHLFEAMLEHNSRQPNADPAQVTAAGRIGRESQSTIRVEVRKAKKKNDVLGVCFSPVIIDGQEHHTITAEGFAIVRDKIGELVAMPRPEDGSNDTSLGLIEALGINRNNWSDNVGRLRVTESAVEMLSGDLAGEVIAWAGHLDGKFWLSYKLGTDMAKG